MNLSMKWLNDYVKIDVPPHDFAAAMTMSGSKVEGFEVEGEGVANVVVGKVLSVERHPDAEKLVVCMVEVGREAPVQIVTGASNVTPGATVPAALDGSTLPGGIKIKKGKLRGVESNGMLCSLGELGLTAHDFPYADEDGIFLLQEDCEIGQDICTAIGLNDVSVEFEITSNRPDCLSVTGLAREAAATFGAELCIPKPQAKGCGDPVGNYLKVRVENTELCRRYMARVVKNVKIGPSPRWMRERLRACGVRPINNLVDITNYVMLEYGQPMHAFDLKYVSGGEIVVRSAKAGETIQTLDGTVHRLSPEMLVICDAEKPAAVAGVMGGQYSGILDDTQIVVFESASFLGSSVRTTAKKLGLRTESSARFEKGLDPALCADALERACELVELLGCGEVTSGEIDVWNSKNTPARIKLEPEWINRFIGIDLTKDQMVATLKKLEFTVEGDEVTAPPFRIDIESKADISEEIARIYGYDNIPVTLFRGTAQGRLTPEQQFERRAFRAMLGMGCNEIQTYSFISPKYYDKIGLPADSALRRSVEILNPLGEDTSVMRTTILPSMLEILARNYNNRLLEACLFEIGSEYYPTAPEQLPEERNILAIGLYGANFDFYTIKGMVETLLRTLRIAEADFVPCVDEMPFHPGRCAKLTCGGAELGIFGEVHPGVLGNYGIGAKAYVARLDMGLLFGNTLPERAYQPLPKFPATSRDLSVVCDEETPMMEVEKAIRGAVGKSLESVSLFDVYRGEQVPEGKKSLSFAITMRSFERTLTDEEADNSMRRVLKALETMGIELRG